MGNADVVVEWQSRPLDAIYPIGYLDCIVVKIRQDKKVINKSIYLAIREASKTWTSQIRNWKLALNGFMVEFEDRLADYI